MTRIAVIRCGLSRLPALSPAYAGELFGGIYVHDIKTAADKSGIEGGIDLQLGYRGGPLGRRRCSPMSSARSTPPVTPIMRRSACREFRRPLFIRPGFGIAIHTGSADNFQIRNHKIEFGSRILFEPELGIGARSTTPDDRGELGAHEPRAAVQAPEPGNRQSRRAAKPGL